MRKQAGSRRPWAYLPVGGAAFLLAAGAAVAGAGGASAAPAKGHQVFVGSCAHGDYATIQAAVDNVAPGGTVHVCPGTYAEDVTVSGPMTIQGSGSTVAPDPSDASPLSDLTGGNNGFTVMGPGVTVRGFNVTGATADGIFVLGDHALIEGNTVRGNASDGINLDGSSWSTARGNLVTGNGAGGIELANDPDAAGIPLPPGVTGTATHDVVTGNQVVENPFACGILLVDHAGTTDGTINNAKGIYDNVVSGNQVLNNAMQGYGAGILLASEVPGGAVYNNLIQGNTVAGNGLSGLTLHSHLSNQNLNGNVVVGNDFGTNNLKGQFEEPSDPSTTGVFVGSQDPLTITLAGNTIHNDYYGTFTAGPVTVHGLSANHYVNDTVPTGSTPTFSG